MYQSPSVATQPLSLDTQPPYTNRGVGLTDSSGITCRFDYLTGTTSVSVTDVLGYLNEYFGLQADTPDAYWVKRGFGGYFYHDRYEGLYGVRVYFSEGRDDCLVWLPGKACEALGLIKALGLVTLLQLRVTRVDVCWDGVAFGPGDIWDAWKSNDVNTKVQRGRGSAKYWVDDKGDVTCYIGSRSGLAQLVCYDMRGFNRLELRLKQERARALLEALHSCGAEDEMVRVALGYLTGFCDFVERNEANVSRSLRLGWWADFVGAVNKILLAGGGAVQATYDYVAKAITRVATTVYALAQILNKTGKPIAHSLMDLFLAGERHAKGRHKALIAAYRDVPGAVTPF